MVENEFSEVLKYNLSTSDLNEAVKMFFTLNSCPSDLEKLYWKAIYINGPNSRITMLASNIVKKSKQDFKNKSFKIFGKISSVLRFQHISYHEESSKTAGQKIKLAKSIMDVKGEKQ